MGQMNFFRGSQLGAPALSTLGVGDLARVLDPCLGTGFTAQSCTIVVAGGVATVSLTANTYRKGQRITIAGVSGGPTGFALLNTTSRIVTEGTNSFTLAAAGVSNGSATGTITAQLAGLGWGTAFTATNQRAYRAASGLRHYLMINDNSNTNTCIVRAFTAMSAVTTGTGPFPTAAQSDTNLRWARPDPTAFPSTTISPGSTYDDSWVLIGDDKRFFIGICITNPGWRDWYGFGEFQSYKPADAYNSFIMGHCNLDGSDTLAISSNAPNVSLTSITNQGTDAYYSSPLAVARAHGQVTQSYMCGLYPGFNNQNVVAANILGGVPPAGTSSPISAGIELCLLDITEFNGTYQYRRGRLPMLMPWTPPDFENNDFRVHSGITNFGDLLTVRGQYANPLYGLIFPVGDWDTVLS